MDEKKTSEPTWFSKAAAALAAARTRYKSKQGNFKIALLGVGNELNGDDGAGILVVRKLAQRIPGNPNLLLVEGGAAPENFSGVIRRFQPALLIFLDVAWMNAVPGTIRWFELEEIEGVSAVTHGLPLSMLAGYLLEETGCLSGGLLIQAGSMDFNQPITPGVEQGMEDLVEGLSRLLG